jgi:periplasmic divalent cation tolerance protein
MHEFLLITTTWPSQDRAVEFAEAAVGTRLAACAQVQGPILSRFRWQGHLDQATEWYCHCKTVRARFLELEALVRTLHTDQVPEIVAVPLAAGAEQYLAWVAAETAPGSGDP